MKISIPKRKWFTAGHQKSFKRLADYVTTHYPKDTQLHKAVAATFKSTNQRRRSPMKRRSVRRRTSGTRRRVARKAPKRRKVARRTARKRTAPKRTARRGTRRVRRVVRRRRSA